MDWKNFEICLDISAEGTLFSVQSEGKTAAECEFSEGMVKYSMVYDYSERPLCLTGKASLGDAVSLRIMPHRIELCVNGVLADEEWPCGKHGFGIAAKGVAAGMASAEGGRMTAHQRTQPSRRASTVK